MALPKFQLASADGNGLKQTVAVVDGAISERQVIGNAAVDQCTHHDASRPSARNRPSALARVSASSAS
ncbi:MAG: hypothetical protein U1B30_13515, partial [Pseudomonadota bacterium]|nr:hypothetical protein [Pseudomonadota bacterium]